MDLDIFRDLELLLRVDVQHLDEKPPRWWRIGPDLGSWTSRSPTHEKFMVKAKVRANGINLGAKDEEGCPNFNITV